jgi:pimeloyl-ACP methyl ester carboxylesterase
MASEESAESRPLVIIPGTTSHSISAKREDGGHQGQLRYLKAGTGAPLVLLHTVRTQAEHFRSLIPLVAHQYTVYALDLPGMGHSDIVRGAGYNEPDLRAGVKRFIRELELRDVTLLGESMGAVLALTTAAELPDRVRRVVAINPYDFADGIKRANLLARFVVTGVLAPGIGGVFARLENKLVLRGIMKGGLVDKSALRDDYIDELRASGKRRGYWRVARQVFQNLPRLIAARARYAKVQAPIDLMYGEKDWSRASDREANKKLLPLAQYSEVPSAGHFISLERPEAIARILQADAQGNGASSA